MNLLQFLTEPYPHRNNARTDILVALGIGFFVGWFIVTFQVGRSYDWEHPYKNLFLWGYGAVTFIAIFFMRFIPPRIFPVIFLEKRWTVGKQILYVLFSFILTIIACYFYYSWFFELTFRWRHLFSFLTISSTIAVFPLSALVLLDYIRQLKKYQAGAKKVELHHSSSALPSDSLPVSLKDEQGQIQFILDLDSIFYLQSAANYVEVFYLKEDQIKKELLRNTLKDVEAQLPSGKFLRVHRSYLVQIDKVEEVTGNAQGYKLHFAHAIDPVPVSRSRSKVTLTALEA